MTLAERKTGPGITATPAETVTEPEMKESSGRNLLGDIRAIWNKAKCLADFHDYRITVEGYIRSDGRYVSRAVYTCIRCGDSWNGSWEIL